MRFLSIATLSALLTSTVYAHVIESRDSHSSGLKERAICPAGQGDNGRGGCVTCPAGTYGLGGPLPCQACSTGSTSAVGASACNICLPGFYINSKRTSAQDPTCLACPAGSGSGANAATCQTCAANTYANGSCTPCPSGSFSSAGSSKCTTCTAGQYWSGSQCSACSAGTYSAAGSSSCSDCWSGTYSPAGASTCTQCPVGQGSLPRGSYCFPLCIASEVYADGHCQSCPPGTAPSNNVCTQCPPGLISLPGANGCFHCPAGSIPYANQGGCTTCAASTYANGNVCSPCPIGMTSRPGSSSCTLQPSKRAQLARKVHSCAAGFLSCPVVSGNRGRECIDPMTTLDSCGGCIGFEGEQDSGHTGRDCSAIAHVDQVECNQGRCEIKSCQSGYEPAGDYCVKKPVRDGNNHTSRTRAAHGRLARSHSL